MFVLYCMDEDENVVRAASGGLAMLSNDIRICQKIIRVSRLFLHVNQLNMNAIHYN